MRIVEAVWRAYSQKKKKQNQGRKEGKIEAHEEERRLGEIQPSGEESNVKERRVMGVLCITIQDAFHCIAVAH